MASRGNTRNINFKVNEVEKMEDKLRVDTIDLYSFDPQGEM